jgi:hypothetical protein
MPVKEFERDGRIFIDATSGNDDINIKSNGDGTFNITIRDRLAIQVVLFNKNYPIEDAGRIVVRGGDGNDRIFISNPKSGAALSGIEIRGGAGNDTLLDGKGSNKIFGDSGNDTLSGHGGDDLVDAGTGRDEIWGTAGFINTPPPGQAKLYGGDDSEPDIFVVAGNDYVNLKPGDTIRLGSERTSYAQFEALYDEVARLPLLKGIDLPSDLVASWITEKLWDSNTIPQNIQDQIVTQFWRIKQAPAESNKFIAELVIALVPFGDVIDLGRQAYNGATGKNVDLAIVVLSALGLAGDLGWLDGIIPDPFDVVNASSGFLKAMYEQMDEPAKAAMKAVIDRAIRSTDEFAKVVGSIIELGKRSDFLSDYPNALPKLLDSGRDVVRRLMDQSDAALHQILTNPEALEAALDRAKFTDKLVGKTLSDLSPDELARFYRHYGVDKNGVIKRASIDEGFAPIRFKDGKITEVIGKASDRLSIPADMKKNFIKLFGKIPEGHQIHHLIPDSVVRDHQLAILARKAGYNLDDANNLVALPFTGEAFEQAKIKIIHLGSHPEWNKHVTAVLETAFTKLTNKFGNEIPPDAAKQAMKAVEEQLWKTLKTPPKELIKEITLPDGKKYPKLASEDGPSVIAAAADQNQAVAKYLIDPTGRQDASNIEKRLQQLETQHSNGRRAIGPVVTLLDKYGQPNERGLSVRINDLVLYSINQEESINMTNANGQMLLSANGQGGLTFSSIENAKTVDLLEQLAQYDPQKVNQDAAPVLG